MKQDFRAPEILFHLYPICHHSIEYGSLPLLCESVYKCKVAVQTCAAAAGQFTSTIPLRYAGLGKYCDR